MRLIDANAKMVAQLNDFETESVVEKEMTVDDYLSLSDYDAPTIDAVPVETVCEMFGDEAPCNYGLFGVSVDDFMMSKCGKWCEDNCDKVPYTECWRKFFEAIEKWRKQNG